MFHNSQPECAFCFFYISACMIPWECLETREQTTPNIRVLQIKPQKKKPKKQHVPNFTKIEETQTRKTMNGAC